MNGNYEMVIDAEGITKANKAMSAYLNQYLENKGFGFRVELAASYELCVKAGLIKVVWVSKKKRRQIIEQRASIFNYA